MFQMQIIMYLDTWVTGPFHQKISCDIEEETEKFLSQFKVKCLYGLLISKQCNKHN